MNLPFKTVRTALNVLILLNVLTLLSSCSRGERPSTLTLGDAAPPPAVARVGPVWRGIYEREGQRNTFRACATVPEWPVQAGESLMTLLDATVDWHAARPSTRIFAQLQGDTLPRASAADSVRVFRVLAVDSTRAPDGSECAPRRPDEPPPAVVSVLTAAARRALGPDSGAATAASMRSASVWLNGDWRPDALVLVRGDRLCTVRGCTLLVLGGVSGGGYELKSRVTEVQAPVVVRAEQTQGWRDLRVRWNGGAFGEKTVVLRWNGRNYPVMASTQPQVNTPSDTGIVIPR